MELSPAFLREQAIKMAGLAEAIVKASMDPEVSFDDLYNLEEKVNLYHKNIDDSCFKFIALKNPTARDLRMAIAIMKINSELERIGDQGISIKRYHQKIKKPIQKLSQLQTVVSRMLRKVLDAFVHANTGTATDVIQADQEANALHRELIEECLISMKEGTLSFEEGFCSIWIAKNFERVGDQCTNIAEDIIFIEKGDDIRHSTEFKTEKQEDSSHFDKFLAQIDKKAFTKDFDS